jgi:hypothetical protein
MVYQYNYTVGTTPFKIFEAHGGTPVQRVKITNHDNASVYVGGPNVGTNDGNIGFTIVKDSNYDFDLNADEELWAISDTSARLTVLVFGA